MRAVWQRNGQRGELLRKLRHDALYIAGETQRRKAHRLRQRTERGRDVRRGQRTELIPVRTVQLVIGLYRVGDGDLRAVGRDNAAQVGCAYLGHDVVVDLVERGDGKGEVSAPA